MTIYTTIQQPDPAKKASWSSRKADPIQQWKFEAETTVDPASAEKGTRMGRITFPDDSVVRFVR